MRKSWVILLLLLTISLIGDSFPVMLQIQGKVSVPEDFRDGIEEHLTQQGYSLIDQNSQNQALKEQAEQRKKACYDDSCLLDTGKMLAARALIVAEVSLKGTNRYRFKARYIDFESGTTTKTKLLYYEASLGDYKQLSKFGKTLALVDVTTLVISIEVPLFFISQEGLVSMALILHSMMII